MVYARRARREANLSTGEYSWPQRLIDRPVIFHLVVWVGFFSVMFAMMAVLSPGFDVSPVWVQPARRQKRSCCQYCWRASAAERAGTKHVLVGRVASSVWHPGLDDKRPAGEGPTIRPRSGGPRREPGGDGSPHGERDVDGIGRGDPGSFSHSARADRLGPCAYRRRRSLRRQRPLRAEPSERDRHVC